MQGSNVSLSGAEQALVVNAEIILTKNSVLQKTVALMAGLQQTLQLQSLPTGIASPPGKISRGENYRGLPYVVLDYPRLSAGDDLLFIRSFFWWGNFFSNTLQLGGCYKERYVQKVAAGYAALSATGYYVGIAPNPWAHHFETDNYVLISSVDEATFGALLHQTPHIKIAARWPLSNWALAANSLESSWQTLVALIA